MIKRSAAVAAILLGIAPAAHALEFQSLGTGSLGLGGAGVARNFGAMAPYWNPAGLAFAPKALTVAITGEVGLQPQGNLAQDLDQLSTSYNTWDSPASNQSNPNDISSLANAINDLYGTTGKDNLRATAGVAVGAQIRHFGFGVFGTFEGGAIPNSAPPVSVPGLESSITSAAQQGGNSNVVNAVQGIINQKTITVKGIALIEIPIAYGHAFDLGGAGKLGVGVTAKYIIGEAATADREPVFNSSSNTITSSNTLTKDLSNSLKESGRPGLDLGLLWKPTRTLAVGLVGKNLNSPSFSTSTPGEKISDDMQVRGGVSITPLSWLELTGDVDVVPNTTVVPDLKTQHLGGGAEFHPFSCLKLRVGGYTDLAQSTSGAATAGLSIGIPWLYFDLDGAYGLGSVRYDNRSYPTEAKVQFSTNVAF